MPLQLASDWLDSTAEECLGVDMSVQPLPDGDVGLQFGSSEDFISPASRLLDCPPCSWI